MHPTIESLFDAAERRYLEQNELDVLTEYVESLPDRVDAYRCLRDREVAIMQSVADQLEIQFSTESQETLERCLRNALLMMRHAAMSMLQNDSELLDQQLTVWLTETNAVYNTRAIDTALYSLLNQQLEATLTPTQLKLIHPYISAAEQAMNAQSEPITVTA
ncbi:MAG: hypothetical protein AAFQ57_02650 [Cyanobacteria bacterium J06626_14]